MHFRSILPPLAAAVLSAVAASLLFSVLTLSTIEERWNIVVVTQTLSLVRLSFIVALVHALLLGLPLYLYLQSKRRIGIAYCMIGGVLVAALPVGLLGIGGIATVVGGGGTGAGSIQYAMATASFGMFGLIGGVAFWCAMSASGQIGKLPKRTEERSAPTGSGSRFIASAAALIATAILVLPDVIRDDSCHNLFRDGRRSIVPQLSAKLTLAADDWPRLNQIFVDRGLAHSLSLRADENIRSGKVVWRSLSLCNEGGVNIGVDYRPWLAEIGSPLAEDSLFTLRVFELKTGSSWAPLTRDMLNHIGAAWPDRITFSGPDGRTILFEEAIKGQQ